VAFGVITVVIAMLVPLIGGIVEMVLSTASIAGGALFAPIIWTLYSKRQTAISVVTASLAGLIISLVLKLCSVELLGFKVDRFWETTLGVGIPILVLLLWEIYYAITNKVSALANVFAQVQQHTAAQETDAKAQNRFGIKVIAAAVAIVGSGIALLGAFAQQGGTALIVGIIILAAALPLWRLS
jgi:hypothetical protein